MTKRLVTALVALVGLAAATTARAAADGKPFFGLDVGAKGGVGGNYLTAPDPPPNVAGYALDGVPYEDGAGGVGGGGGLYAELRVLWGHLGLELDVLFEANKNWCNIEFNNVVETDWITRFNTVRIPLLLEGSVENDLVRGSLGIGPEFVVGTKASTDIEVTAGAEYVDDATLDAARDGFRARQQTDTFLCVGVGLAFKVWRLAISLDIRYAYNLGQPEGYSERMHPDWESSPPTYSAAASSTMDMRLLLGIAYEARFGSF